MPPVFMHVMGKLGPVHNHVSRSGLCVAAAQTGDKLKELLCLLPVSVCIPSWRCVFVHLLHLVRIIHPATVGLEVPKQDLFCVPQRDETEIKTTSFATSDIFHGWVKKVFTACLPLTWYSNKYQYNLHKVREGAFALNSNVGNGPFSTSVLPPACEH